MASRYPLILPTATMSSYELNPVNNLIRTEMDTGYKRVRRKFTTVYTNARVRFIMNPEQLRVFEAWFRYELQDGAEWFILPLKSGVGSKDNTVRFINSYSVKMLSDDLWEINSNLEINNLQMLTPDELYDIIGEEVEQLEAAVNKFDRLINYDIPITYNWTPR